MPSAYTFDIETIPQELHELNDIQKEELDRLVENQYQRYDGEKTEEDISLLIRGTNPFFGKIICIGACKWFKGPAGENKSTMLFSGDENDLLQKFFNDIGNFGGIFVHYNGLDFDIPFIMKRAMHHNIQPTSKNFTNLKRYSTYPHFDLMQHIANWDRYNKPTLHLLAQHVGIPSPKEGEVKGSEVYSAWKAGRSKEIFDYCLRDVDCTHRIFMKVRPWFFN